MKLIVQSLYPGYSSSKTAQIRKILMMVFPLQRRTISGRYEVLQSGLNHRPLRLTVSCFSRNAEKTRGEVIDRETGCVLLRMSIPAEDLIKAIPSLTPKVA